MNDFHRKKKKKGKQKPSRPDPLSPDVEVQVTQPKRARKHANALNSKSQSRKWQTTNLVSQQVVFVHRSQIKHAEVHHGAARDLKETHSNEIKFGRVSDPYGDFSPLLLTLTQEHNPNLLWGNEKKLRKQVLRMMKSHTVELMGGAEEAVADPDLKFTVFGHQHLFQVKSRHSHESYLHFIHMQLNKFIGV